MARKPRWAPAEYIYHVISRGNNKQNTFLDENDYYRYLYLLKKYKKKYPFEIYHYALMPNHVHLMIKPLEDNALSKLMKSVNSSYALYFRKKYGGIGHFWQDRFKSIPILSESYHLQCGAYIELNPVKANLSKSPQDYRWNSYRFYVYDEENELVTEDPLYENFGSNLLTKKIQYIDFVNSILRNYYATKVYLNNYVVQGIQEFTLKKLNLCLRPPTANLFA